MLELVFLTLFFAFPLLLGLVVGRWNEARHCANLARREQALAAVPVTSIRLFLGDLDPAAPPLLVCGEVAIASDFLKNFLASFRKIIGGRVRSYETLVDRARREANLRMIEQAVAMGYNAVCNVRLQTVDLGVELSPRKKQSAKVVVQAWGTAYRIAAPERTPAPSTQLPR